MAAHARDRIATAQVTVTSVATQIAPANSERSGVMVIKHGSQDLYLGIAGVSTSTGALLAGSCGTAMTIPATAAVYGILASGSLVVSYLEAFDG